MATELTDSTTAPVAGVGKAPWAGRVAVAATLLVVPGALTVYLAFRTGGFFPGTTAVTADAMAVLLAVRAIAARDPLRSLSPGLVLASGALALFALWTLLSGTWSHSSSRALLSFDRALMYLLVLLFFGSFVRRPERVRSVVWSLAAGFTAICLVALLTRTVPDVWSAAEAIQKERLSHPIGYWNALGLVGVLGGILCFHLAASEREPPAARVLGAAALPLIGATVLFTFSRGPILVAAVGLVLYVLVARPRLLPSALLATVPATAIAVWVAYDAELLASKDPTTPAAASQGHHVIAIVALCVAGAALVRGLMLLRADGFFERVVIPPRTARYASLGALAVVAVSALLAFALTNLGDRIQTEYQRAKSDELLQTGDFRDRLTNPGFNRDERWNVALDAFADDPLKGHGAGTYPVLWTEHRPRPSQSEFAHSLYLEVLGELGIVGLLLLLAALLTILAGMAALARGPERATGAALLAAGVTWALHAGIDWDWQVPVTTAWLFAAGGVVLAAPVARQRVVRARVPWVRAGLVAGCIGLAATPAVVAMSEKDLSDSLSAYDVGDCRTAAHAAAASIDALSNRPDPYEVLGYCSARSGEGELADRMMSEAIERDPEDWELYYGLALVRASFGQDPRGAADRALRFNPLEPRLQQAVKVFRRTGPSRWRRSARELGLSLPRGVER